jgi:hypothetical protein
MEVKQKKPKTGGRKKGTPNKITTNVREAISSILDDYFLTEKAKQDMNDLDPKDRVTFVEKLIAYIVPKLQSTTMEVAVEEKKTIEDRLLELSSQNEDSAN